MEKNNGRIADIHMLAMLCVAFRRETYEEVWGRWTNSLALGCSKTTTIHCGSKRSNLRVVCAADVFVHHFGQAAFKHLIPTGAYDELFTENRRRFESKWSVRWIPHQNASLEFQPAKALKR